MTHGKLLTNLFVPLAASFTISIVQTMLLSKNWKAFPRFSLTSLRVWTVKYHKFLICLIFQS